MFVILIYDISSSKERKKRTYTRICKTVESYLRRVQFSVFEGEIQPHQLKELIYKLKKEADKAFDSIIIYSFKDRGFTEKISIGVEIEHSLFS